MGINIGDKDIEFALHLLNHPESIEEEESRVWLAIPEHRILLQRMRNMREAGLWDGGDRPVDIDAEWKSFERHFVSGKIAWMRKWQAVAAILLLGIALWGIMRIQWEGKEGNTMARMEYKLDNGVVLVTDEDPAILVRNPQERMDIPGATIFRHDSLQGILYVGAEEATAENKYHTLKVPRAADYMIILEDSTCVWLNAESELHYPLHFGKNERVVELKGEAYFKVRPDAGRPFKVKTDWVETRVLGTEFNFQAYSDRQFNVTLVKGSVGVKTKIDPEIILQPGQNISGTEQGLKVEEVDILKYTAWKDGYFYYDNTRLEDILIELGRWYDFEVTYQNEALKEVCFKFWAGRYESFERMLMRLNATGRVTLQVEDRHVTVNIPQ